MTTTLTMTAPFDLTKIVEPLPSPMPAGAAAAAAVVVTVVSPPPPPSPTNLDILNRLLRKEKLGIPDFRTAVTTSGNNLKWLRKTIPTNANASCRLKHLVSLDMHHLLELHVPEMKLMEEHTQ